MGYCREEGEKMEGEGEGERGLRIRRFRVINFKQQPQNG